ncbi:MAG: hypothetical protein AAFU67_17860, partial [Bacteroidota bacterium]
MLFLPACGSEEEPIPATNHLLKDLTVLRFEQDLFSADTTQMDLEMDRLTAQYPDFTDIYFRYAIPLQRGDFSPEEQANILRAFLAYPLSQELHQRSKVLYEDFRRCRADLETAMSLFRYYVPNAEVPDTVITFISQFEFAGFLFGQNKLGLGLDMFLGPDFDYFSVGPTEPIFSNYLTRTYTPDHLTSNAG